jgi:PKHD-type hydroxylase
MHVIQQVLAAAEIEAIRDLVARARFSDGAASAHGAAREVKANQQLESSREDHQRLVELVFGALHRHREFSRTALPLEISVPMVNRYGVGMTYGAHYDKPFMPTPDGPRIRGDLSATLFLSNPEDYDGGELCFARVGTEERIKLKAGDLFLYPASTLHWVAPVTRGERLAVVFWIQSMIRDHDRREMVVELDGLVGRVNERMPGSTEVRDLAGIVGNLTRMWAELMVALAVLLGAAVAHSALGPSAPAVASAPALEPPRSVDEVRHDRVAVERPDRPPLVVAVGHAPDRAASRPRREDVVQGVADQERLLRPCAEQVARMYYGQGVGFLPRKRIPADYATEEPREILAVEEFLREAARLVRDAAEAEPERLHPDEPVDDPGVGSRPPTGLLGVPALEERKPAFEQRGFAV